MPLPKFRLFRNTRLINPSPLFHHKQLCVPQVPNLRWPGYDEENKADRNPREGQAMSVALFHPGLTDVSPEPMPFRRDEQKNQHQSRGNQAAVCV